MTIEVPKRLQDAALALGSGKRHLIALAGAPASGKSTLAEELVAALNRAGHKAQVIPMDGFHLDNRILEARGLLPRKGAPETFDARGFLRLVRAIAEGGEVIAPVFDRTRDIAIAGAVELPADCDTVVFEGNYLLFDQPPWSQLLPLWDLAVRLDVPAEVLRERLIQRWLDHGLDRDAAVKRAEGNDIPNADRMMRNELPADIVLRPDDWTSSA